MKRMMFGMAVLAAVTATSAQAASVVEYSGTFDKFVDKSSDGKVDIAIDLASSNPVAVAITWGSADINDNTLPDVKLDYTFSLKNFTGETWNNLRFELEVLGTGTYQPLFGGLVSSYDSSAIISDGDEYFVPYGSIKFQLGDADEKGGTLLLKITPTVRGTTPNPDPSVVVPTPSAALAGMIGLGLLGLRRRRLA